MKRKIGYFLLALIFVHAFVSGVTTENPWMVLGNLVLDITTATLIAWCYLDIGKRGGK